jgi:hypothetical protein
MTDTGSLLYTGLCARLQFARVKCAELPFWNLRYGTTLMDPRQTSQQLART